jgi:hypothetical protein
MASFAALTGQKLPENAGPDSFDNINALLGKDKSGREWLVEHSSAQKLSLIRGDWKFIEPGPGQKITANNNTETGNDPDPQLYNLSNDLGEKNNVATQNPDILKELTQLVKDLRENKITRK